MPAGQTINVDRGLTFHGGRSALYCVLPNLVDNWEIAHLYWSLLWRRKKTKARTGGLLPRDICDNVQFTY